MFMPFFLKKKISIKYSFFIVIIWLYNMKDNLNCNWTYELGLLNRILIEFIHSLSSLQTTLFH